MKRYYLGINKTGYSLVEVLFGIWLFSAVFILLTGIFLNNYMVSSYAPNYIKGTHLAHNRMLALKSVTYDLIRSRLEPHTPTPAIPDNPYSYTYMAPAEPLVYSVTETIRRRTDNVGAEEYDILDLEVKVEWRDMTQMDINDKKAQVDKSNVIHTIKLESAISPVGQY